MKAKKKENGVGTGIVDEAGRLADEISLLHRISQAMGYDLSLSELLSLVVNIITDLMGSKICSVQLLDEEKGELSIAAAQCLSKEYLEKPNVKVDQSVSGKAVRSGKPQTVADVRKEKDYGHRELAEKEGIASMLCVPMVARGKVIGVINSYGSGPHDYSPREVQLLSLVAAQAAIAIENARLQAAAKAAKQDLETRKLVERAKGILMKEKGLAEPEAFRLIQKQSMNTGKPMRTIAEAIVLA